jgi:nicotinate-nucleotide pyrophosphorylase (carboxylating)
MSNNLKTAEDFRRIVQIALLEDRADCDITTTACVPENATAEAEIVLKSHATICGLPLIPLIFEQLGQTIDIAITATEGMSYSSGTVIARIRGNAQAILIAERVMLNLLQLASSVATKTALFVEAIRPNHCDILDTRKTLPGLRSLQKYAVKMAGGKNHRSDLASYTLIKDNHLAHVTITQAVEKARALHPDTPIEVEIETLDQLKEALACNVGAILLDNMQPAQVSECVRIAGGKSYLEASGGITLASAASYAKTGINGISIGALTHSIDAVDISLNM